ncbi:MAG: hypothetical protein R3B57_00440 [Phycisphaerales bacterium]
MPTYEYRCEASGKTIEVEHAMSERLTNWGELCRRAGISPGTTPPEAPVEKLISLPSIKGAKTDGRSGAGPCGPSCGCHPHG